MSEEIKKLKEEERQNGWHEGSWSPAEGSTAAQDSCENDSDEVAWGLILVLIGATILFGRFFGGFLVHTWWVWFFIVPAGFKLFQGLQQAGKAGRLTQSAASQLSGGTFLLLIGVLILTGWSWSLFWPLLLVFLGLNGIMWAYAR